MPKKVQFKWAGVPIPPAWASCLTFGHDFVAAELEVEEAQDTCLAGTITHFGGLVGIASERLVAQHRVALLDRTGHVVEMHERR